MRNIIFDVDGTLWNTTEVVAQAWNKAVEEAAGTKAAITAALLKKEFGKPMDVIADDLFGDIDEKTKQLIVERCYVNEHLALNETKADMLYPDVLETLKELSKHCRLFIVSNCQSGYIELFMKKNKIEELITDIECYGNTGKSKGENIRLIMERNKLRDAVYVGDTLGDYEATRVAGIPFIHAQYGFGEVKSCEETINHFKELLNIFTE